MKRETSRQAWTRRHKGFTGSIIRTFVYDVEDLPEGFLAKELKAVCELIIRDNGFYIVGSYDST